MIEIVQEKSRPFEVKLPSARDCRIGVVFCGRQAPGGLNIIAGLLRFCKKSHGTLFGFRNGTKGLFEGNSLEIDENLMELYMNQGGFHLLGRSSDSIRAKEFPKVERVCSDLELDGLVVIGATHTLTDAMYLSNYF